MRKITINNHTSKPLKIKYNNLEYEIKSNDNITVDFNMNEMLKVCSVRPSSYKCLFGMCFFREDFRNLWLFCITFLIDFISCYKTSSYVKKIDITEGKHSFLFLGIFNLLIFNDNFADSYAFVKKKDKTKALLFLYLLISPLLVFEIILLVGSIYGCIYDFSAEFIFAFLVCTALFALIVSLIKNINKLNNVHNKSEKVLSDLKRIRVFKETNRFIKFTVEK